MVSVLPNLRGDREEAWRVVLLERDELSCSVSAGFATLSRVCDWGLYRNGLSLLISLIP